MQDYGLFRSNREDKWGESVVLYVAERLVQYSTVLAIKDNMVETPCMRIKGMESKADVVGVFYWQPYQNDGIDELFERQLWENLNHLPWSLWEISTSSQTTEGISRCYSWTPLNNLPNVLRVLGGLHWLEVTQSYNHLLKGHERSSENCKPVSLTLVSGKVMDKINLGGTEKQLMSNDQIWFIIESNAFSNLIIFYDNHSLDWWRKSSRQNLSEL